MAKYCFWQYNYLSHKEVTQYFNSEKGMFMHRS